MRATGQGQMLQDQIEDYFNDDSTIEGFKTIFDKMMTGLDEVAKQAGSGSTKAQFIGYASNLTQYFNSMSANLSQVQKDVNQEIKLKVRNNVYCHDCLFVKKGTIATARIETIITKGMNGFPAEIILNNFKIDGVESSHLMGEYIKAGRSWALMVYPIKWALTPIPFVGSLTNLIKGGDANIETDDLIIVKYYPHWR